MQIKKDKRNLLVYFKTYREHRKCRNYKFSFVFLCFSYLFILNEPFRRGHAQIIHKIWACMGPLQNTKPSMTNIQHNLYKIEVHPIYSHQNMTQKCKTWPLQNHLLANWGIAKWIFFFWRRSILYFVDKVGFELVAQFRLERCLHLIIV